MQAGVIALAIKAAKAGPMEEVSSITCEAGKTLVGAAPAEPDRGITLISAQQWAEVNQELSADLPWHTRRANVLLDCGSLGELIGKTITIGQVEIAVLDETHPCGLMDKLHKGLTRALAPDHRGGVLGRITKGGEIAVGDTLQVVA